MVGAPAAADAVARARRLPGLGVGLHLVVLEGSPVLPDAEIPLLVRGTREFDRNMARAALRYFLRPAARRQLAREIRAQFAAFAATGLPLDHVNVHRHLQVHPTVARLLIEIGRDYGMRAVRVPAEPLAPLRRAFPGGRYRAPLYRPWIGLLRRRLRAAGILFNDHLLGLAWTGAMVEKRVLQLLPHLPDGITELYFHPAAQRTPALTAATPQYRHRDELVALVSPAVQARLAECGLAPITYRDLSVEERRLI
jgi:hopanoid biosynthesis associated protein HpnK